MTVTGFEQHFGSPAQGESSAPGRVNLIGEFTDYNEGWVLPCALEFRCRAHWRRRPDNKIVVVSQEYPGERDEFDGNAPYQQGSLPWANYVRAVVAASQTTGYPMGGIDLLLHSNVPQGRGLSSSAALEVAVLGALASALDWPLETTEIARLGQLAENQFIGCQCGIMDQLVSAAAEPGSALLLDCQSLETTAIGIPEQWTLVVLDSNHPRQLVDSEYNDRRRDCELACRIIGVNSLRAATPAQLEAYRSEMTTSQFLRAKHVIEENQRVQASAEALANGRLTDLAQLLGEGHRSLADQFEVTVAATDALVAIAKAALGDRVAARQTGGGFGGAVICLCHHDDVETLVTAVHQEYGARTGLEATVFSSRAGAGLELVSYD